MNVNAKIKMLALHNIEHVQQDGKLFALDVYTLNGVTRAEWTDVTRINIAHWLGY